MTTLIPDGPPGSSAFSAACSALRHDRLKPHADDRGFQQPPLHGFVVYDQNAFGHFIPYVISGLPQPCPRELNNGSMKQVNCQLRKLRRGRRPGRVGLTAIKGRNFHAQLI